MAEAVSNRGACGMSLSLASGLGCAGAGRASCG